MNATFTWIEKCQNWLFKSLKLFEVEILNLWYILQTLTKLKVFFRNNSIGNCLKVNLVILQYSKRICAAIHEFRISPKAYFIHLKSACASSIYRLCINQPIWLTVRKYSQLSSPKYCLVGAVTKKYSYPKLWGFLGIKH